MKGIGVFAALEGSDTVNIEMKDFIKPQYDQNTHLLQYILFGEYAKTEGAIIRVTNAKIDFFGEDGKTVTAILKSPEIFYNQTTEFISGNKPIHYRAEGFDADGVGFDASMISESLHVRKDVTLIIKSFDETNPSIDFNPGKLDSQRDLDSNITIDSSADNDTSINPGDNLDSQTNLDSSLTLGPYVVTDTSTNIGDN